MNETIPLAQGICAACCNGAACPDHEGAAISQCEQFVGTGCTPSPRAVTPRPLAARGKGLCSVCWLFLSCTLPKPSGGVWQCDEYR